MTNILDLPASDHAAGGRTTGGRAASVLLSQTALRPFTEIHDEKGVCLNRKFLGSGGIAALLLVACSRGGSRAPAPVQPPTLEMSWLRPSDGAALSDTVRIEIQTQGDPPQTIEISADGVPIASLARPPWILRWLPDGTARSIRLGARSGGDAAPQIAAPPLHVAWSPNEPPRVRIIAPRMARGVDCRSIDSLRAEVIDPEEGGLHGPAIAWVSENQGQLGLGDALPFDCLILGPHRITVRAVDRWLRAAKAAIEIEAFAYTDGTDPEGTLEDVRHAWLAADEAGYVSRLSPGFSFNFCPADREEDPSMPIRWGREEELAFFRSIAAPSTMIDRIDWHLGSIQETSIGGRRLAKAEIDGIRIVVIPAPGETLEVAGGRALVYLSRSDLGPDRWRIDEWRDRGGETAHSQGVLRVAVRRLPGGTLSPCSCKPSRSRCAPRRPRRPSVKPRFRQRYAQRSAPRCRA